MDDRAPAASALRAKFVTHEVANQPPELAPYDAWASDLPLQEAMKREGGGWAEKEIAAYGAIVGGELVELGRLANENKPKLKPFDRFGHQLNEVEFHPAYHRIMELGIRHGVPNLAWRHPATPGAHVARAALCYLHNQPDQGTSCPLTMTYACVPALRHSPAIAETWLPRITAAEYDPRTVPAWSKRGNTIGMCMTEKQGGSDVRSNTTRATPCGSSGNAQIYELVGHKWFASAPMCDAFLVLAQAEGGLSCFLMPRFTPGGERNALRIPRLKDKLGDHSNASSEMELQGAMAWLVGEEGRGVANILQMVALTRQDCLIGAAGLMRQALVQAIHHARHRKAFGKLLVHQPLMQNVLADLALEAEAATALSMRVARAVDATEREPKEAAFARIATAIGKYWACKRAVPFVNEAQECLGGAGYVEESILPRLYRQAPLSSIWEGSGNIQCLDVLRALGKDAATREALFTELAGAKGGHPALDAGVAQLATSLEDVSTIELRSRSLVEQMALLLQGALLVRAGNRTVSDAFCESRLGGAHGAAFGTLSPNVPLATLIDRAFAG